MQFPRSVNKTVMFFVLFNWFMCEPLFANEEDELAQLLELLDEQTEIATQNKMNADYVPGMVSILHGQQLESYGATTVAEGLERAAGFYMSVDNAGSVVAIVRGIGATLDSTNLKMMLNGVAMNRPYDGSTEWLLRLPLEQVERIEVIRGPGSSLYGEFAFSAVVNVITHQTNQIKVKAGEKDALQGDLLLMHEFQSGLKLSSNFSWWQQGNSGLQTNPDDFYSRGLGYSPGDIYDHKQGKFVNSQLEYLGYKLQLNYSDTERGGWYGRNAAMPQDMQPRAEQVFTASLAKSWQINDELKIGINLDTAESNLKLATFLPIPKGVDPPGPEPEITTELYRRVSSKDSFYRGQIILHWQPTADHKIYLAAGHGVSKVDEYAIARFELNQLANIDMGAELSNRKLSSFTIQNQWSVADDLEITLGARHDKYADWGSHTSPRVAAVWRQGEHHIFKFQFADAFRPPTMRELNPDSVTEAQLLTEEKLQSTELSYIYRDSSLTFRSTVFDTQVDDLIEFFISPGESPTFRNLGSIQLQGIELEFQQQVNRQWQWFANLSYTHAQDDLDEDQKLAGSVDWLANLGVTWQPSDSIKHALSYRYVGTQEGWELAPIRGHNTEFSAQHLVNYTVSAQNPFDINNMSLGLVINNLFDENYDVMPNPANYPTGLANGYRMVWLKAQYEF
ncbi:TonB-dependent receptor plug domain-containing protein [Catenovulum sp. SX2]|uniref:TonB-dependent receptor plug domain-containing protein n=1 Tax=Catenovulum sp. SX2 TaxID=3398614 RepID=UPI003F8439A8